MIAANEIRQKYLDFFKTKGHKVIPSASLLPENDPTTLFTGSGMQPMVPYLLGEKHPEGTRIVDSQKSFRSSDIEEVGDNRHTTFFEMLGNWSLGDYFKKEQIEWIFEFLTSKEVGLGLDPERLYISVYRGNDKIGISKDEEAVQIWQEQFKKFNIDAKAVDNAEVDGMQGVRIFYFDEKENWWSRAGVPENMPVGEPGGPDSEMFWDLGADLKLHESSEWKDQECHPACDCGRFVEIGNNVFMQYVKNEDGFAELENKNIDFGGGLERLMVAVEDNPDIFACDIFGNIRKKIEKISGKKYGENEEETKSFRVIMDHLRGATFLIGDGAMPSNKDQGYFTRRLIRRAVRFAHGLGVEENFTKKIAEVVIADYAEQYENLVEKKDFILDEIDKEEKKFRKTLITGLKKFEINVFARKPKKDGSFWTYEEVEKEARENVLKSLYKNAFDLYQTYGFPLELILEEAENRSIPVEQNVLEKSFQEGKIKHQQLSKTASAGKFKGGLANSGEETKQLHTVAHLMLAALRKVLGEHVQQKGSNITAERLRFDFSHPEKLTDEQKTEVENLVNEAIENKVPVVCEEMPLKEAKEKGAVGVFDSKYCERVKVYKIVGESGEYYSNEICGGPHVANTSEIKNKFKIKKEQSSGAGVRRIKAVLE